MMVLVIFLVMNFNASGEMSFVSKDMLMAAAEHGTELTRVPIIAVSKTDIYFEGARLLPIGNIDSNDPNWRIAELDEKLVEQRQKFEAIGKRDFEKISDDPTKTVNVQIDVNTDFKVIKRVLYTCEQAGYVVIRLAVGDARKVDPATLLPPP
jgi:Biopolymer transport protein ExbD/TolR